MDILFLEPVHIPHQPVEGAYRRRYQLRFEPFQLPALAFGGFTQQPARAGAPLPPLHYQLFMLEVLLASALFRFRFAVVYIGSLSEG